MKRIITILICSVPIAIGSIHCSLETQAQEYATFELTGEHQGRGNFNSAVLSDFSWGVEGTLAQEVQILDDEVFDDGNQFENMFGQANNAQNLRIQIGPNGSGTIGQPVSSTATLTIDFDKITPANKWGFCIVDLDVENCLISAIDENDNQVPVEDIDNWLIELFDTDLVADGINIPKWDASHAALLGSDTPDSYVVYNNVIIGGMPSNEAAAAFFRPDTPLQSLTIYFENLQTSSYVSLHFYFASLEATAISEYLMPLDFVITPVPATNTIRLKMQEARGKTQELKIYNVSGKEVISMKLFDEEVDVSELTPGLYFIRLQVDDRFGIQKIIIQ